MSTELQVRVAALEVKACFMHDFSDFTSEDAAKAEELRVDMLAFTQEPSFRLGKKFTETLRALEELGRTYPPCSPCTFVFRVLGCHKSDSYICPPVGGVDARYRSLLDACFENYNVSGGETLFINFEADDEAFYREVRNFDRPIRADWNANFQVGVLFELFHLYYHKFVEGDDDYKYEVLTDPDYYVQILLPDLVAPEDQLPGCKYVKCYNDVKYLFDMTHDDHVRAVAAMPCSSLVPPGYGVRLFYDSDHLVLGSHVVF